MNVRHSIVALLATAAVLCASTAGAATYFVSPTGSSANAGTAGAPWTLSKANSSLAAGDVAVLLPGDYGSATIAPAASGASYTKFISYVGSLSNPASTIVAGITFGTGSSAKQYISVKGVQINSSTLVFGGARDSVSWCKAPNASVSIVLGGDDCVLANSTFSGSKVWVEGGTNGPSASLVKRDTLYNCSFNMYMDGYGPAIRINATDGLVFRRCRFIATIGPNGDHGTFKLYGCRTGQFIDCYFDFTNTRTTACDECGLGYFRDYTQQTVFLRDTLIFRVGAGSMNELLVSASGSFPGTVVGNRYDGCLFIQEKPVSTGAFYWQNGAQADTIQNCVVLSIAGTPIEMSGFSDNCVIRHNTFVYLGTNGRAGDTYAGGAFEWSGAGEVKDNIFYSPTGNSYAFAISAAAISGAYYSGDNNLLFSNKGAASSMMWSNTLTTPGPIGKACINNFEECHSKFGDPLFVGGTGVFGFDPHLKAGSPAIGAASDGKDIGALAFGTSGVDSVAPAAINNVTVAQTTDNSAVLAWTATGDDGSSGQAALYEVRVSSQPITDANFASAGLVANAMTPMTAGSAEQFVVAGLSPGTIYFFAIKAIDDVGNKSIASNAPTTTTAGTDTIPPGQIQDLNAGP